VDEAYERGVASFVRALTEGEEGAEARRALLARRDALARWSGAISLVQTAVRLTAPGVADTYQGSEWENRSVVDPDNRRAVDFEAMEAGLGRGAGDGAAWGDWRRAETKIRLVARLHGVRRACARVFREGSYEGLETSARESVMAFARRAEEACVVLCGACARRGLDVSEVEVERPMGADRWRDALTGERFGCAGERIRLEGAWSALPVRVLVAWGE
jgi:maltooligosyltrehalose synthase